jgi:hypothetical protein
MLQEAHTRITMPTAKRGRKRSLPKLSQSDRFMTFKEYSKRVRTNLPSSLPPLCLTLLPPFLFLASGVEER